MKPPFNITPKMTNIVANISKLLGQLESTTLTISSPKLRRKNRIKTIKSTLAIEGNTLTLEQVTAVLDGKRVLGAAKEVIEVENAMELYNQIDEFKFHRARDFLKAHKILMNNLVPDAGKYRSKNVGVLAGTKVKHVAPKPIMVPELISKTFAWLKAEKELHPLILSSIIHYEIEFIHPFADGNGRMGRFWQALILASYDPFFKFVPIENMIEKNQKKYYQALEKSDRDGDSTFFVEFMLKVINNALDELSTDLIGITVTASDRLEKAKNHFGDNTFSRKEYMELYRDISTATASRDLRDGVEQKKLRKEGEKNQTIYFFR